MRSHHDNVPRVLVTRIGHSAVRPPRECRLLLRGGRNNQPLAIFRAFCTVCNDEIRQGEQYVIDDYSQVFCVACVDWTDEA